MMPTRLFLRTFLTLFPLTLAAVLPARAQEPAPTDPAPAPPAPVGEAEELAAPKKKEAAATSIAGIALELHGRVLAAGIYDADKLEDLNRTPVPTDTLSLTVPSARASLRAGLLDWVTAVIEIEISGRARLRDGFVQARQKRWMVRGGQFKMPISSFQMESPWVLPLARRGWLHELISDRMLLTGRREGFMGRIEGGGFWDPAFTLGVFRSVQWGVDAGDPIPGLSPGEQTLVARLSTKPAGVEVAAVGQQRVTRQPLGMEDYWAGGVDATGDWEFEKTGVRFWAEPWRRVPRPSSRRGC
jgi:hypothetical protein